MNTFITRLSLFTCVVLSLIFLCNRNYYPSSARGSDGFMAAIIDKHAYADRIPSPRIIFCGGSNLAFGINSQRITKATGLPVVNLGLNGSLGLDFMINEAKYIARSSDIIILSTEYDLLLEGSYRMKKETAHLFPLASRFFKPTPRQLITDFFVEDLQHNLPSTLNHLMGKSQKTLAPSVYYRSSFNENGDIVRNFSAGPSKQFYNKFNLTYSYYQGIALMNELKTYADKNNMRLCFMYPVLPESLFKSGAGVIRRMKQDFDRDLNVEKLNSPTDGILADSLFYDTEYHLWPLGREYRTDRVIRSLQQHHIGRNTVATQSAPALKP